MVEEVAALLLEISGRWWLSGGWGIDEFATGGRASREHGDVDVSVARQDWPAFWSELHGRLDLRVADAGRLDEPARERVGGHVRNIWAREWAGGPWRLQINLEETEGDLWRYRRNPHVSRPISQVRWWSGRTWCIAPAVQLLWKAKSPRPNDEHDCAITLPKLPVDERAWLAQAIRLAHPESPWADRLRQTG